MPKESIENQPESIKSTSDVESIPRISGGLIDQNELALPLEEQVLEKAVPSERREIAKSASLVMLGNLGSSVLGMVRQVVITAIGSNFGGPFNAALLPARTFNDFLVNGSVSGALIPTFNDYSAPEKRDELRRIVFTIVNLLLLVIFTFALLYLLVSPYFVNFLVSGFSGDQKQLTLLYSQIVFFSLLALGPFAVLLAALFALKEFGWPAFATGAYHVGIIGGAGIGALLGARYNGHLGLAVGVLFGAAGEVALLLPGIRNKRLYYMFVLDLKHPALRRIVKLYGPVAFSFLVSMGLIYLDQNLASRTPCGVIGNFPIQKGACGPANYTAMRVATTLIQFPTGLVAAALS